MKQNKYAAVVGLPKRERIKLQLQGELQPAPLKRRTKVSADESESPVIKRRERKKKEKAERKRAEKEAKKAEKLENEGKELGTTKKRKLKQTTEKDLKSKKPKTEINVVDGEGEKDEIADKAKSLKEKLVEKLSGARFRFLNEQLYSMSGDEASELFKKDKEAFRIYHAGYQSQCARWPKDPLEFIVSDISKMHQNKVVADMGCGDGKLATRLKQTVHSFDLVAVNERVTECNIQNVPLKSKSVDVCVFCLSLMGTNLSDYIKEANRILKKGGILKIAEIASRFKSINTFIGAVEKMGFQLDRKKKPNDYFYLFDFTKTESCSKAIQIHLQPCLYKKR